MRIAILGYGVEGESVYSYYRARYPDAHFVAYDNHDQPKNPLPAGVEFVGGVKDFKGISADLAVKTPAIAPWDVEVSGEVTTMTREFIKTCPAPIIGVTGTKGKGTTASLITSILDVAGKKTWLVGNIGVGAFDVIDQIQPDDVVVYELSSFQLWDCDVSPHVAVVLGIEPEHLDVHRDMDDYVSAKANIAAHQTFGDVVIYKAGNRYSEYIAKQSAGGSMPYQSEEYAHISSGLFYYGDREICPVSTMKITGAHFADNACAAITAVRPWVTDNEVIARGLSAFEGLPHRLKFVREVEGVNYYDDSIATTPGSAIAALDAFSDPKIIILGGSDKGATYEELAQKVSTSNVRQVLLIGSEAPRLQVALDTAGLSNYTNLGSDITMQGIVQRAAGIAQSGDTVILSPACASFDMFESYSDRGDQFIAAVNSLA